MARDDDRADLSRGPADSLAFAARAGQDGAPSMSPANDHDHAPRLPFGFALGITGHRINGGAREPIEGAAWRLDAVIETLTRAAEEVRRRDADFFTPAPTRMRLVSPLADGADQMAARLALARGFDLEAILPFNREIYATDFHDPVDAQHFNGLLAQASAKLELPGDRSQALDAYVNAGRAVVAHADVMLALWDGEPARGRGGTAEIVEHALRRGLPVIHIHLDPREPTRILWTGYDDPPIDVLDFCDAPDRGFDAREAEHLMSMLLAPPTSSIERECIHLFGAEREQRTRVRIEYPLLLALLGVRRVRVSHIRVPSYAATIEAEWRAFHLGCADASHRVSGGFEQVQDAYRWSDKLAEHYAVAYRSGHVLNFLLAALATLLALAQLILPHLKYTLMSAELGTVLLFITNTRVGIKRQWHRRWLDYRHLAEQLRPMRSLKLCALARPCAVARRRGSRRWIDWYAAGFWRAMGCPDGRLDPATLDALSSLVVEEELRPQLAYHRSNALRMNHVEHRLLRTANLFFVLTLLTLVVYLFGHAIVGHEFIHLSAPISVISAGLPAIAAAMHGIREQGEFARTSIRSGATASALEKLIGDLTVRPISATRASALTEEAAKVMLDDVGEWRMSYEMRNLALPA